MEAKDDLATSVTEAPDSSTQEAYLLGGGSGSNPGPNVKGGVNVQPTKAPTHSRQSSLASSNHSGEAVSQRSSMSSANAGDLGDCHRGIIVGLHRKMVRI